MTKGCQGRLLRERFTTVYDKSKLSAISCRGARIAERSVGIVLPRSGFGSPATSGRVQGGGMEAAHIRQQRNGGS